MGGTSTDVSLIDGKPRITTEAIVSGGPIRVPILDIHTIGAGGGSIARLDVGGALRVGPESAGANPGPACYGRGDLPTVTDANVVLQRIPTDHFLGGKMPLDFVRARTALERLGKEMNLSAEEAALGVVAVANAKMERALRVISIERGHDPRAFTLLSFGGAGGLHALDLARSLGIQHVLVPPMASTLSAFGMLAANIVKDYTLTVMLPGSTSVPDLAIRMDPLVERGRREILAEGVHPEQIRIERFLDMRYRGQSYELIVPFCDDVYEEFHHFHEQQYGYANRSASIEVVNLRVQAIGLTSPPPLLPIRNATLSGKSTTRSTKRYSDISRAILDKKKVIFPGGSFFTPLYQANELPSGCLIKGPAVVVRPDTTILLHQQDKGEIDLFGNLIIKVGL
jgi:N-methylhydantoinase A